MIPVENSAECHCYGEPRMRGDDPIAELKKTDESM